MYETVRTDIIQSKLKQKFSSLGTVSMFPVLVAMCLAEVRTICHVLQRFSYFLAFSVGSMFSRAWHRSMFSRAFGPVDLPFDNFFQGLQQSAENS